MELVEGSHRRREKAGDFAAKHDGQFDKDYCIRGAAASFLYQPVHSAHSTTNSRVIYLPKTTLCHA